MSALLDDDRCFGPDARQIEVARELYRAASDLPLICPHGHVDPRVFAEPDYSFGTPVDLLLIPDHYVFRMLYSQGVPLESLGIPRVDGASVETDHRKIWQPFAERFYLFRGTPTGLWLTQELVEVFGVEEPLKADSAQRIYDQIAEKLASPDLRPRRLFERFNVEALCTTDAATDTLEHHQTIRASGWNGDIRPTFRPDGVVNLDTPHWHENIERLGQASGIQTTSYAGFIEALERQRAYFKSLGATASEHAAISAVIEPLSTAEAESIFQRASRNRLNPDDPQRFTAHMLFEMARMSLEDGLGMQLHPGVLRNHNAVIFERFGPDKGADIPLAGEFTRSLLPLLQHFGADPRLRIILFTLDEASY
jgi:glucuronate isomerase